MKSVSDRVSNFNGRLYISDRSHLVFPFHKILDGLAERARGKSKVGTSEKDSKVHLTRRKK